MNKWEVDEHKQWNPFGTIDHYINSFGRTCAYAQQLFIWWWRLPTNKWCSNGNQDGPKLHAPPPASFTAFLALNVANFTSVKRADVYLTDLLNTYLRSVRNNNVYNAAKHSVSDIKYFVPFHPFLVVMIAVKDTKSVSFLKLELFNPTGLTNDFLLFDHIPS